MANTHFILPLHYKELIQATQDWSDEEFGCYLRLLIHQWDRRLVPEDIGRLKRIAESIEKNQGVVLKKFEKVDGGFLNKKMEDIRTEKDIFSKKQALNGSKGGRKVNPNTKPKSSQPQPKKKPDKGEGEEEGNGLAEGSGEAVLIHPLQKFINEIAPKINQLKDPLTYDEADRLVTDFEKEILVDVIEAMQNYKQLTKKYDSANLTIRSWANRRKDGTQPVKNISKGKTYDMYDRIFNELITEGFAKHGAAFGQSAI